MTYENVGVASWTKVRTTCANRIRYHTALKTFPDFPSGLSAMHVLLCTSSTCLRSALVFIGMHIFQFELVRYLSVTDFLYYNFPPWPAQTVTYWQHVLIGNLLFFCEKTFLRNIFASSTYVNYALSEFVKHALPRTSLPFTSHDRPYTFLRSWPFIAKCPSYYD